MDLEVIGLSEEDECLGWEENSDNFEFVKKKLLDIDKEKGIYEYMYTIKRISDGKLFKGLVTEWGQGNVDFDEDWEEHIPKTKKK